MALNIQDSRILIKRSTNTGEVPTVAPSNDHTDGTWDALDIYTGELFLNVADSRAWFRSNTAIIELATLNGQLGIVIDGAGSVITTGVKGYLRVPYNCTINSVEIVANVSGSIVVDIWKDTYANFPPVVADAITASAKPTLSSAQKSQSSTLTGWTTSLSAGDYLAFNVDSVTTVSRVTLTLVVTRTT